MELNEIDKESPYFHMELLKYYYNFINFYKQEENKIEEYLHFDFDKHGLYVIQYKDLIDKAFVESEILKEKYSKLEGGDDKNYKI